MIRKGLGKGLGIGYKNLLPTDSYIHSLSAKGIKKNNPVLANVMSFKIEDVTPDIIPDNFGTIPTYKKKGLIKEIARKVQQGVGWAVKWEKEHLPKQKAWVKKEFKDAKNLAKKVSKTYLKGVKKREAGTLTEQKKADMDDVRDELDIDNDGIQDISLPELEDVNQGIKYDLETIDLDSDNVPDYRDTENPLDIQYKEEIGLPKRNVSLLPTIKTGARKVGTGAKRLFTTGKRVVGERLAKARAEREMLESYSSPELKELAIRERNVFGQNKYEKELLRRIKAEAKIDKHIKRTEDRLATRGTGVGMNLGFLNPLAVGQK